MRVILFLVLLCFSCVGCCSAVPDFNDYAKCQGVVFFLSTTKSGSNLISASLSAITRKPISWLWWKGRVFDPAAQERVDPSYNRLNLPLVADLPLLYRTHYEFAKLRRVPSALNKLIFVTRNPKELLYRAFFLTSPSSRDPDPQFIKKFLGQYLKAFDSYHAWFADNRLIVFYEDFIQQSDEILVNLLDFMGEEGVYFNDFKMNRDEYLSNLLTSYSKQHQDNKGGSSSIEGPQPIYYTRNAAFETLQYIDEYIERVAPHIWEKYLKRYESLKGL